MGRNVIKVANSNFVPRVKNRLELEKVTIVVLRNEKYYFIAESDFGIPKSHFIAETQFRQ
jgi:hypothetical protein